MIYNSRLFTYIRLKTHQISLLNVHVFIYLSCLISIAHENVSRLTSLGRDTALVSLVSSRIASIIVYNMFLFHFNSLLAFVDR